MTADEEPIVIDGREMWRVEHCAAYIGVEPKTWTSYTARPPKEHPIPKPIRIGRTPLWVADEIKEWHANRPGSPIASK
ncbi:hypothetical protein [Nocardia salmonicida]|uniref:hypothetical protein n=1 Tax=Nocardia salmonicida TaxID=53431 RepID=UPI00363D3D64